MNTTTVNAVFSRKTKGRVNTKWLHLQSIEVPLPIEQLNAPDFRKHVRAAAPRGEGWTLESYRASTPGRPE